MASTNHGFGPIVERVDVSAEALAAAWANLASGRVISLGLNGKIASGKDSVGPAVLARLGVGEVQHLYFANALKDEIDDVVAIVARYDTVAGADIAAAEVAETLAVPVAQAAVAVAALWVPAHTSGVTVTARTRTPEVRFVLQYWGTQVRRAQDRDYWVVRTLPDAIEAMAAGRSVYTTDVRFPNEADGCRQAGMFVARLEVSAETQRARLVARDGIEPDPAMLGHESETALDGYDHFDLIVDNNGPMAPTVEAISEALSGRVPALI